MRGISRDEHCSSFKTYALYTYVHAYMYVFLCCAEL